MATRPLSVIVLCTFVLAGVLTGCSSLGPLPAPAPLPNADQQLSISMRQHSIAFVATPWQTNPEVLFRAVASAGTLFFARQEIVLPLPAADQVATRLSSLLRARQSERATSTEPAVLRLSFIGANPDPQVVGKDQLRGIVNYIVGNDPTKWQTNVPTYGSIAYEQLYPGIDLLYSGSEGALKGTYSLAAGANPGDICWRYDGASEVELSNGELLIRVDAVGETPALVERRPLAWQTVAGQRTPVEVRYVIHDDGSIGFAVGGYDAAQALTIDPTLDLHTYFGGSGRDGGTGVAVDCNNTNYVYIAGMTDSADFPSHAGPGAGNLDMFVTKLDRSKTGADQVVYTTFVGGADEDKAGGLGVDCSGKTYTAGFTWSNDFPATPGKAYQSTLRGDADGAIVQLKADGTPEYISYLGGSEFEELVQMALGNDGLMVVVGFTGSSDFPTKNAFQPTKANSGDAFVSVLDTSKSGNASLVYSTFYGGSGEDEAYAINALNGIVYFAGHTTSTDLNPTKLKNPIQAVNKGGDPFGDGFLVKLDPSQPPANQLLFGTYFGGSDSEVSGGVTADAAGNAYWVGYTGSTTDFPRTMGPSHQGGNPDNYNADAFLVKLDTTTPQVVFSRLAGGSGDDGFRDIVLDAGGNAYVSGGTGSQGADFLPPNWLQTCKVGQEPPLGADYNWFGAGDTLIARFDAVGAMTFGTCLGGAHGSEAGAGIALDGLGNVLVVGGTTSDDLVTTANAYRRNIAGVWDVQIASIGGLAPSTRPLFLPIVLKQS